jgi:hypothetical protein
VPLLLIGCAITGDRECSWFVSLRNTKIIVMSPKAIDAVQKCIDFKTVKIHYGLSSTTPSTAVTTWLMKFPRIPRADKSAAKYVSILKDLFLQKILEDLPTAYHDKIPCAWKDPEALQLLDKDSEVWPYICVLYRDHEDTMIHILDEQDLALAYEDWKDSVPMNFYFEIRSDPLY